MVSPTDEDVWITEFDNVSAVLDEVGVVTTSRKSVGIHRTHDGEEPACNAQADAWEAVDSTEELRRGGVPCRDCYWSVLDYLADREDNPVERVEEKPAAVGDGGDAAIADGGLATHPPKLTTLPEEVVYTNPRTYHAPDGDGEVRCGASGSYHRIEPEKIPHHDPCGNCFDLDAIDEC